MEIQNFKPIQKGCLLGKFDIIIPEWGHLTISDCVLFSKEGKRWISLPSREFQSKDGQKKHFSLIKFKPEVFKKLQDAALALLEKLIVSPAPIPEIEANTNNANVPF